jgi:N-acetylneuraminic acid mutarotase
MAAILARRWLALAVPLAAGCSIKADFNDTQFRCDQAPDCPQGQVCIEGVCGAGAEVDGGEVDSGEADGGSGIDAGAVDPLLAPWSATTPLPQPRDYNHQHAAWLDGMLYVTGGYDPALAGEVATVYAAPTDADGTVGAWSEVASLPAPRALSDLVADGRVLYAIGGAEAGESRSTVYFGDVGADGTIDAWSATAALPEPRKSHAAFAAHGFVYAIGGADQANQRAATAYVARIVEGGALGAWQEVTPLPEPRAQAAGVYHGGFIYVIGGDADGKAPRTTVYYAPVDPADGAIGAWREGSQLPEGRVRATAAADAGHLYLFGGEGLAETAQVLHAPIGADGAPGAWQLNTALPVPRSRHASVAAGGYFYVLGGAGESAEVFVASRIQ